MNWKASADVNTQYVLVKLFRGCHLFGARRFKLSREGDIRFPDVAGVLNRITELIEYNANIVCVCVRARACACVHACVCTRECD